MTLNTSLTQKAFCEINKSLGEDRIMLFDLKESTKVTRIFDTFFFQKFSQQKIDI